jgi:hypothetical protein
MHKGAFGMTVTVAAPVVVMLVEQILKPGKMFGKTIFSVTVQRVKCS